MTANTAKRERVQSAEVEASVGEVVDSLYIPIDNFNAQCDQYGLPFKMAINSVVEDYYRLDGGESPANKENEE